MDIRFQKASVAVHDAIHRSRLTSSGDEGPPARYRLTTSKSNLDDKGSVRRWSFGQQDNSMQNKIILMVGETGTGKTTLINAMVNYILGVQFKDEVWFEITQEGGWSDQSKSQTSEITVYEVFPQDSPICLTLIDTPGYGDTRGTDLDKQIAGNLHKLFLSDNGVKEIDAVCLVVKASENRLSNRQQYIFDAVLSLFGKDIENNIVILVTYSDGMPPVNVINAIRRVGIPCRKDEQNEPECFLFNNRQAEKRSKKYTRPLQVAWDQTEESLNDFFGSLKSENRKSLEQTSGVLSECKTLEACINNLQFRIDFVERKRKELSKIRKTLEENREKIKKNESFTFTVTASYKVKVPIENASLRDRKATTCSVCMENCHEKGCWLASGPQKCEVMKNGHCTSCTGKCHYSQHVKENMKYVTRMKEITMAFEDIKQQYDSSKKQEGENICIEKSLKNELINNKKEKSELVDEAYGAIMKMFEIALKPDSAFVIQCLDFLIPRAEELEKHDYARKLRELRDMKPKSHQVHSIIGYFNKLTATGTK